jgi:hypothetical protein
LKSKIDLSGMVFGRLTVLNKDETKSKEKNRAFWNCQCSCENKTIVSVVYYSLLNGTTTRCRKCKDRLILFSKKYKNLTDETFGLLKVIGLDIEESNIIGKRIWTCQCQCESKKIISVIEGNLKNGHTTSCGCRKITATKHYRQQQILNLVNTYNLDGDFGIGYTVKDEEFWFDKKFYDKIKDYYWSKNYLGYIISYTKDHLILLHRFIMNCPDSLEVDHIKTENRFDNRVSNLRICTSQENSFNRKIPKNNISGVIGVGFDKSRNKWKSQLKKDNTTLMKRFDLFEDAVKQRLIWEKEWFGEFAPQTHLFEQYGIIQ